MCVLFACMWVRVCACVSVHGAGVCARTGAGPAPARRRLRGDGQLGAPAGRRGRRVEGMVGWMDGRVGRQVFGWVRENGGGGGETHLAVRHRGAAAAGVGGGGPPAHEKWTKESKRLKQMWRIYTVKLLKTRDLANLQDRYCPKTRKGESQK